MTVSEDKLTKGASQNLQGEGNTSHVMQKDENASIDWVVTSCAAALILAVVVWGLAAPESFANFSSVALGYVVDDWGWLYVLAGSVFVGFILFIAFSRFGHIRLGKDNEAPEFNTASWIAMMFAAGMGIGLMFYGVTEPLTHYRNGVPGGGEENLGEAMATTLFHWGLHPWALYAIVALAIAYGTFRLGRKQLLSSAFIPLIGEKRANGWIGKVIDIATIFATVFGTAASLGLGAVQISSGLDATSIITNPGTGVIVGTIVILGLCFLVSAASGVGKGIQYISNANMVMAGALALFVLVLGPTVVILNLLPTSLGNYLSQFFDMASRTANSSDTAGEWLGGWTIFYWAWWVSWSPFVGMFLARISRGRTIREFVTVILLVPTLVTVVWFSIFGGSAIHAEQTGNSIWGDGDSTRQLFNLLETLPLGHAASILAMVLLATFFITSADSASTVMDTLSNLQNVTIIAASPFVFVIIALMFAIVKALANDPLYLDQKTQRQFALRVARERRMSQQRKKANGKRNLMKGPRDEVVAGTREDDGGAAGAGVGAAGAARAEQEFDAAVAAGPAAEDYAAANDAQLAHRQDMEYVEHTASIGDQEVESQEVYTGDEVVEVVKVTDIEHIVEAAQAAAISAESAAQAAVASAEAASDALHEANEAIGNADPDTGVDKK